LVIYLNSSPLGRYAMTRKKVTSVILLELHDP